MRGIREENLIKHSKLSKFHSFLAFQFLMTIPKNQAASTTIGKQPKGSKYVNIYEAFEDPDLYIYIWYPPQNRHFQDCNAFGIVTLFSLRSSGAVSYIYMHIYIHICILFVILLLLNPCTQSIFYKKYLQTFANACKRS